MWDELYEKHYPELLRYAAAACHNQAEAEDVAQEVFLRALQMRTPLKTWAQISGGPGCSGR